MAGRVRVWVAGSQVCHSLVITCSQRHLPRAAATALEMPRPLLLVQLLLLLAEQPGRAGMGGAMVCRPLTLHVFTAHAIAGAPTQAGPAVLQLHRINHAAILPHKFKQQ